MQQAVDRVFRVVDRREQSRQRLLVPRSGKTAIYCEHLHPVTGALPRRGRHSPKRIEVQALEGTAGEREILSELYGCGARHLRVVSLALRLVGESLEAGTEQPSQTDSEDQQAKTETRAEYG
jgi:hypothetical protein